MTPDQRASQGLLQAAIEEHVQAHRKRDETVPEMVGDWVVIAHMISYDNDGDETAGYQLAFVNGGMAAHRAVGLMHEGIHLINFGKRDDDDDS